MNRRWRESNPQSSLGPVARSKSPAIPSFTVTGMPLPSTSPNLYRTPTTHVSRPVCRVVRRELKVANPVLSAATSKRGHYLQFIPSCLRPLRTGLAPIHGARLSGTQENKPPACNLSLRLWVRADHVFRRLPFEAGKIVSSGLSADSPKVQSHSPSAVAFRILFKTTIRFRAGKGCALPLRPLSISLNYFRTKTWCVIVPVRVSAGLDTHPGEGESVR